MVQPCLIRVSNRGFQTMKKCSFLAISLNNATLWLCFIIFPVSIVFHQTKLSIWNGRMQYFDKKCDLKKHYVRSTSMKSKLRKMVSDRYWKRILFPQYFLMRRGVFIMPMRWWFILIVVLIYSLMNELNECMDVEYLDYEENKLYDRSLLAENSEHLSHKVDYSNLKLHQKCYKNKNPIHIILNYSTTHDPAT